MRGMNGGRKHTGKEIGGVTTTPSFVLVVCPGGAITVFVSVTLVVLKLPPPPPPGGGTNVYPPPPPPFPPPPGTAVVTPPSGLEVVTTPPAPPPPAPGRDRIGSGKMGLNGFSGFQFEPPLPPPEAGWEVGCWGGW